jgi:hypothetical protein
MNGFAIIRHIPPKNCHSFADLERSNDEALEDVTY